jgi:hypothetical protein
MHVLDVTQAAAYANPLGVLSPEGALLAVVLAVIIDTWGLGGPRLAPLFDRLAFVGWISGWSAGFQGSGLTTTISGVLTDLFGLPKGISSAPLFVGLMNLGPQLIGLAAFVIAFGCFIPARIRVFGHLSQLEFAHLKTAVSGLRSTMHTRAGVRTGAELGPPATAAPGAGRGGNTLIKRLFPGQVNLGVVTIALIVVTFATVIKGGIGVVMQWVVGSCLLTMAWLFAPLLHSIGMT